MAGMVIVGAGLAGVSAAEALRMAGYAGEITLFDDEGEYPYDRPPLSKSYLSGAMTEAACHLRPADWYGDNDITLQRGVGVSAIDPVGHEITTGDGGRWRYERLLLATGARARPLPGLDMSHPRVVSLRSLADARALRAWLRPGMRAILIGGGVIGMECAAAAAQAGCNVTVLEAGPRIMARFFPTELSAFLADRHAKQGVTIHTNVTVAKVTVSDSGVAAVGVQGGTVEGDFLIAGIGAVPNVSLAAAAGLRLAADAIAVDAAGQTSAAGIHAAGDCAAFASRGETVRWENWTHAIAHAQHAARAMLGQGGDYDAVPWVWSDQYEFNIQVTGAAQADNTVLRGAVHDGRFTLLHLSDGRIVGGSTVNNGRDKRPLAALVRAGVVADPHRLADVSVPLKSFAPMHAG